MLVCDHFLSFTKLCALSIHKRLSMVRGNVTYEQGYENYFRDLICYEMHILWMMFSVQETKLKDALETNITKR